MPESGVDGSQKPGGIFQRWRRGVFGRDSVDDVLRRAEEATERSEAKSNAALDNAVKKIGDVGNKPADDSTLIGQQARQAEAQRMALLNRQREEERDAAVQRDEKRRQNALGKMEGIVNKFGVLETPKRDQQIEAELQEIKRKLGKSS